MPFDFAVPCHAVARAFARDDGVSMCAVEPTFPGAAFASRDEVRYAHQLRLQLREYFLRRPVPPTRPWSVGAD
jgi:hypothetical protein